MTVVNLWVGAVTHDSARVIAKASSGATSVELLVSTEHDVSTPTTFGPAAPDAQDIVAFDVTGLTPGTRYFYALDEDSTFDPDVDPIGRFLTHPAAAGEAFSFTFVAGGCAGLNPAFPGDGTELDEDRISNHPVFGTIRNRAVENDWLFFVHTGDMHYYNLGGSTNASTLVNYRRAYDDVLHQSNQQALYRDLPLVYMWDDHDYDSNDSDGTFTDKANAQQVYRERVPSYPLAAGATGPIYYSFRVGRVLFVVTDLRSERSPAADPDDESKTMLGSAQKTWLTQVLASTFAEMLVWVNPQAWLTDAGAWPDYGTEANELVTIFDDHGWRDRMMVISGDSHYLAMDDGTNTPGQVPLFVTNHLDSSPSSSGVDWSQGPVLNDKGQYGTVTIDDDGGDTIAVTWQGWNDSGDLLRTFSFTIGEQAQPPAPDIDPLPQVAQAVIRTRLTWLSCNLSDGALIEELPDLDGDEVSRVIGEYTSANLSLPIPSMSVPNTVPADERLAAQAALAIRTTQPPRVKIVAVVNDVPVWEGIPLPRDLGTDAQIPLGCVSMEGYLRHVYIGDHTFDGVDVSVIAAGLLGDAVTTPHGPGIALVIDAPQVGVTASRSYLDIDDQTVYAGLSELMDAALIEWTLEPDWRTGFAYRIVDTIARVRGRLGKSGDPQAVFQSATFSSQGASDARYNLRQDYGGDRYANVVRLRGVGQGEDQPRSAPAIDQAQIDAGVPVWEMRDSAPQAITEQDALDLHATQRLDRVRGGAQALEITARWDAPGARLGVDWQVGDSVRHELRGHAHPDGLDGVRRAIGFALSIQGGTIRPILQEEA